MKRFAALLLIGCASREPQTNDLPYKGDAWVESRPTFEVPKAALAVVTNNLSDTLSLIDLTKNTVIATRPIDVDPLAVDGPHHAVVDPTGEFIYTPLAYPREGSGSGPHASHGASQVPGILVKLRSKDLARVGTLTVENNPGDIVMTRDGKRALISHFDLAKAIDGLKAGKPLAELRAAVVIVDTQTMTRVAAPTPCVASHGMALSADDKTLYLACYGEDALGIIDVATGKTELVPLGAAPAMPPDVTYGPYFVTLAGASVLVSETEGKAIRAVDLATKKTTLRTPLGGAVMGPTATKDGRWIVPVQAPDKLVILDKDLAELKTRTFGSECINPHQVARHGDRYLLVCEGNHVDPSKIVEIDPTTLETIRSFDVGLYPDVIAFPLGEGL
jgi:DNA-binding beta-propeller fold protein YncE